MKSRPNVTLKSDEGSASAGPRRALCGMFARKERWGLTLRGWLVLFISFGLLFAVLFFGIHPFLAVTKPTPAEFFVVEGWVPEYAIKRYAEIFKTNGYQKIISVGGPVGVAPDPVPDDDTHAYVGWYRLKQIGVDPKAVEMVPSLVRDRDRTYNAALALKKWLALRGPMPKAITVATLGVHGRRTRLLYQKAFGDGVEVGVISVRNEEYEPDRWWKYSEGVKEVMSEGGAYLYARFLFRP